MNLNDPKHPWSRLAAAARTAPDDRDTAAPYGFTTRVAALALAEERKAFSLFERFALRAVAVSCLLAVLSVAVNYAHLPAARPAASALAEEELTGDDSVAVLLSD
jgi:hypothetical protein